MFNYASRRPEFESLEPRLLLSAATESAAPVSVQWRGAAVQARADEWIVRLKDGPGGADAINSLESSLIGSGIEHETLKGIGQTQFGLLKAPGLSPDQAMDWANKQADVLYIEPNFAYSLSETISSTIPDDPAVTDGSLWGLHNTGQSGGVIDADIDAPEAWDITTGSSSVVLAVIDTGIDYTHPDLIDNLWMNPGEIAGDDIDNDSNGYVDDVYGWNFVNDDNDPMDGHDHGTHVSGTIGGVGNDATGVSGVNWDVSIMALKFLDDSGSGYTSDAIEALNYATMMRRDHGVNVVAANNSWGGSLYSSALLDAIEIAGREGILFIAAASNEGQDNDVYPTYPSNYDSQYILSVAATDRHDQLAHFSNYGATTVDLGAPGVSIYSTVAGGGYDWFDGTSMAAPHVTGVAGLLSASQPGATAGEIKDAILAGLDPAASLAGKTITGGRLNAYNALLALGTFGPRVMSVSPSGGSVPVDTISMYFSEGIEPTSVVGVNFMLRDDGADNIFDNADDNIFVIGDSDLSQPEANRVVISLGAELTLEDYRLTIVGSGVSPVRDPDGNALNNGSDQEHFFTILSPYGAIEPNDTLATAVSSGLTGVGEASFSGEIGDGVWGWDDVDLFEMQITEPVTLRAETDTDVMFSELDTVLRLFDAAGAELARNDDWDFRDSLIQYELTVAGTYYIGVSGYSNFDYDPSVAGSWFGDSIGDYYLTLNLLGRPEIHGNKWDDLDGDGIQDDGESPLVGWAVFLDSDVDGVLDVGETSTTTDAEGNFSFAGLTSGVHVVGEVAQTGWTRTYPVIEDTTSYVGHAGALEFEDISSSGQGVLVAADDDFHYLSAVDLGGFEFPLYDSVYDEIYINSNGLLTFEAEAVSWLNGNLSLYPEGAAIAVFWDDLVISGSPDSAVYWEVRGSGADQRLIIQWQHVEFFDALDPGSLTFQAVLRADGRVTLSYSDLVSSDEGAEGEFATVGVKDSQFFGRHVLLSYNSGPGTFVGTGKSTHLVHPMVGQHSVALEAGQIETGVLFGSRRNTPLGDINGDGAVDNADVDLFADQFGVKDQGLYSDFDGDGDVDLGDFAILRSNHGTSAAAAPMNTELSSSAVVQPANSARAKAQPKAAASKTRPLKKRAPRREDRMLLEPDAKRTRAKRPQNADVLTCAIPLDINVGGLPSVSDRGEIPGRQPVTHLLDRGDLIADSDVDDGFSDIDDILDIALDEVLGGIFT
jgi:subtilisin family serine protease